MQARKKDKYLQRKRHKQMELEPKRKRGKKEAGQSEEEWEAVLHRSAPLRHLYKIMMIGKHVDMYMI